MTHACARISGKGEMIFMYLLIECRHHRRLPRALSFHVKSSPVSRWGGGGGEGWFSLGRFAPRCARESMNVNGGTDGEIRSDLLLVDLRYHFRPFEQSSSFFFFFSLFFMEGLVGGLDGRWSEAGVF